MVEIRSSLQAADDLDAIVNYIAADSENYASLVAFHILKAVERLELLPKSGRVVSQDGQRFSAHHLFWKKNRTRLVEPRPGYFK